ncbi:MAG: hypothetical protein IT324_29385 [Anaerolineae bacterium]|nr:hypothetical protein [Anaerolineae bacterium]
MQALFSVVDHLMVEDLRQLRGYIERRAQTTLYTLSADLLHAIDEAMRPVQQEAESMRKAEINAVIDAAIAKVR